MSSCFRRWFARRRPARVQSRPFRPQFETLEHREMPASLIAVGVDFGPPAVKVYNEQLQEVATFFAFNPRLFAGVRVAVGDVNGDSRLDVIVAAGAAAPHVKVIDGTKLNQLQSDGQIADSALLASFFAFDASFGGGVNVAAGDTNGDGRAEVIVGAGVGAPHVKVIDATRVSQIQPGGQIADSALLGNFFGYDSALPAGASVAAGDVNADGRADVIVAPSNPAAALVRVINARHFGNVLNNGVAAPDAALQSFFAYESPLVNGVALASGDVNGDGNKDVITAPLGRSNGNVRVFSGLNQQTISSFTAGFLGRVGGVRVGSADITGDNRAEVFTTGGRGEVGALVTFDPLISAPRNVLLPFGFAFRGGMFVAAGTI